MAIANWILLDFPASRLGEIETLKPSSVWHGAVADTIVAGWRLDPPLSDTLAATIARGWALRLGGCVHVPGTGGGSTISSKAGQTWNPRDPLPGDAPPPSTAAKRVLREIGKLSAADRVAVLARIGEVG